LPSFDLSRERIGDNVIVDGERAPDLRPHAVPILRLRAATCASS